MLKKYNYGVRALFLASDLFIILACWVLAYLLRFDIQIIPQVHPGPTFYEHLRIAPYALTAYFLCFSWLGLYAPMRICKIKEQFFAVLWASTAAMIALVLFIYFFMADYRYSRVTLIIFLLLNIGTLFFLRYIALSIFREFRKKGFNLKHVLIIGSGSLAVSVAEKLSEHLEFGFHIKGFLARDSNDIGKEIVKGANIIGTYESLFDITRENGIDQVLFCVQPNEERLIRPLLNRIDNERVDLKVILELGDMFTFKNKTEELDGLSVLSLRESPLVGWQNIVKRLIDIVASLLFLIVAAPLIGGIALLIRLTSKGPVFYSQRRVGMDGKEFTLYKFRTMINNAEISSGAVFAKKDDPRATTIGKILRRFSLDELPQLINVLKSDLSLVGPRPERPEFITEFYNNIPRYMLRHKIRMGMTGWAQINGLRGADSCIKTRLEHDLYYIKNWSFWLDLKIVFLTFFAILKGKGAY